jgi:hypothetical protein
MGEGTSGKGLHFSQKNLPGLEEFSQRDKRGGWSLLTVETEVNGDSKSTNERGPSLIKKKIKFSSYIRKFRMERCKVILTNGVSPRADLKVINS